MVKRVNYEDLIIDLYIFERLERESGNMSTAKLLFLFEEELYHERMIGSHYVMKKFPMGPYNDNIGTNIKNLALNGYLNRREQYYEPANKDVNIYEKNNRTTKFIEKIDDLLQEYGKIFTVLDDILYQFKSCNAEELKDFVYSLPSVGFLRKKIQDYELHSIILNPQVINNPKINFVLDEDWYDTIEVLLNPDLLKDLQKGIKDVQTGNVIFR